MVNIYFGCSMRGGHNLVSEEDLAKLPQIIESLGYTLPSKHQTQKGIIKEENKLTKKHIHDRNYNRMLGSDAGVFEISNPSLGVGGEISDLVNLKKPVLCLFKKGLEDTVSAYIQGKMGSEFITSPFEVYAYIDLTDAKEKIDSFVKLNC